MSKKTFLLILFLLSFNYFSNTVTSIIITKDVLLIAQWLWCIICLFVFQNQKNNRLNTWKNQKYVVWFLFIILISTLAPYLEYNQPILNTLISQRANYSIAVLLVLFYIHPTTKDIFSALKISVLLSVGMFFYSIINPEFFLDVDSLERRINSNSTDVGASMLVPGFWLIAVYFYYLSHKLIMSKKKDLLDICFYIVLILVLFLVQNRQTLIITIPVFLFTLFKIRKGFHSIFLLLFFLVFVLFYGVYIQIIFDSLINETTNQLNDDGYNRYQAIYVYLFEWNYNLFNVFFGHGVPSINSKYTNTIVDFSTNRGAYFQDIGFFGSFFLYGLPFIILNYYFILQGFLKRKMPYYIKFWCFGLIILPVFQNWGMMNNDSAIIFALLFYLIIFNKKYNVKLVRWKYQL